MLELEGKLKHGLKNCTEIHDALDIHDCETINAIPTQRPDWVPPFLNQAWATPHLTDPDLALRLTQPPPTIIRDRPALLPA